MRVFVTGASGWVGAAIVDELIAAGHSVLGLARSDSAAAVIAARGAEVQRGTLDELAVLQQAAAECDAVIHTGFLHDFSRFAESCELDRRAILAMGEVLKGSAQPLLVTGGMATLAEGRIATENDLPRPASSAYPRSSETTAAELAARGVRAATVRLPPSVFGEGDHGFVPHLVALAREKGIAAYIDDGSNRWPSVHRRDAARVYRLALEHGVPASTFHAVADEGMAFRQIAERIAQGLNLPAMSLPPQDAAAHFGWFAGFAAFDVPASSALTRAKLAWEPTQASLMEELALPHYFREGR